MKEKEAKKKTKLKVVQQKTVSVLDAKAMQNVAIIMSTYKLGLEESIRALKEWDEDIIDVEASHKLKSWIASVSDWIDAVKSYTGDMQDISETEIFVVSVVKIPLFDKRINSMMFKYNFDAEYSLLSENVTILKNAWHSIKEWDNFKTLIRMILDIGNFLNFKTPKGNAYGFKLQSLKDLAGVKSKKIDGDNYSLLDYVIINIRDNEPKLLEFAKIFIPLAEAVKIDIDVLEIKFTELEKQIKQLDSDLIESREYINGLKENNEGKYFTI